MEQLHFNTIICADNCKKLPKECPVIEEVAFRAIVKLPGNELLMLSPREYHSTFLFFPGRMMGNGETLGSALYRSVLEQVGMKIDPESAKEIGHVKTVTKHRQDGKMGVLETLNKYYVVNPAESVDEMNSRPLKSLKEISIVSPKLALCINHGGLTLQTDDYYIKKVGFAITPVIKACVDRDTYVLERIIGPDGLFSDWETEKT